MYVQCACIFVGGYKGYYSYYYHHHYISSEAQ